VTSPGPPSRRATAHRKGNHHHHADAIARLAARLDLRPVAPGTQGHHLTDAEGRTYRVMTREVPHLRKGTSFDFYPRDAPLDFDVLLGVLYSPDDTPLALIRAPGAVVRELVRTNRDSLRVTDHEN
jgi:hypothetical protein